MAQHDPDIGMKCIKYMLFTTNFMFAMIGFLLISVGSTITAIYGDFDIFVENQFFNPATLLVATGVIIFFVAMFGCFGAIRESTCLVNMYALLLAFVLILELSAAIAAYSMRGDIRGYVNTNMRRSMQDYKTDAYVRGSWDFLQEHLECCGVKNASEWNPYEVMPESCYYNKVILGNEYKTGCLNKLSYIISECAGLVGTGALCVAIVQFLGIIFAGMLAKSIRRLKTQAEMQRQENQRFYAQLARGNSEKPTPVLYTPTDVEA